MTFIFTRLIPFVYLCRASASVNIFLISLRSHFHPLSLELLYLPSYSVFATLFRLDYLCSQNRQLIATANTTFRSCMFQFQHNPIRAQRTHDGGIEGLIRKVSASFLQLDAFLPAGEGEPRTVGGDRRPADSVVFLATDGPRRRSITDDVHSHVRTGRAPRRRFHVREEGSRGRCPCSACALQGVARVPEHAAGLRSPCARRCRSVYILEPALSDRLISL